MGNKEKPASKLARLEKQNITVDPFYITEQETRFLEKHYPADLAAFFHGKVSREHLKGIISSARERREQLRPNSDRNYPGYD